MEIVPVVEVELRRLDSPSRLLDLLSDLPAAWASLALLVAATAAVLGFARRVALVVVTHCKGKSVISRSISFSDLSSSDDDYDSSSEDEEDDDEAEAEAEEERDSGLSPSSSDRCESVGGRQADRPELSWTGPIVRSWEGAGLAFDRSGGVISLLDMNRREILRSFRAPPSTAASLATPVLLITAESAEDCGDATVTVWDARAAGAAVEAEWRSTLRRRKAVRVAAGGEGKVYVGDEGGGVVVADLRNGQAEPLEESWWDADAVNVDGGVGF